ncbi:hypothetical protein [Cedecea sp.]|jgi:hypothetical protein|uniref:hypothetical protein n=1 Tax=Cedecea sp. TaxID=1970739 RepID=UPI002F42AFEA
MKQANHDQRSRLPRGVAGKKRIPMSLSNQEISELEAIAATQSRSVSSMARLLYLRGIESFQAE